MNEERQMLSWFTTLKNGWSHGRRVETCNETLTFLGILLFLLHGRGGQDYVGIVVDILYSIRFLTVIRSVDLAIVRSGLVVDFAIENLLALRAVLAGSSASRGQALVVPSIQEPQDLIDGRHHEKQLKEVSHPCLPEAWFAVKFLGPHDVPHPDRD